MPFGLMERVVVTGLTSPSQTQQPGADSEPPTIPDGLGGLGGSSQLLWEFPDRADCLAALPPPAGGLSPAWAE